ncbi:MAG: hypothetical protein ACFE9S_08880 [Candidatus Hermodarchaeota archaeon]
MSEEEKFNSIIQEIKDIYIYLTQGEPTPDDEITAREKLINLIQTLKSVKNFNVEANMALFEDTLNKLDSWDTLELWFLESELPGDIEKIIKIKDDLPEFEVQAEVKESPTAQMHEDLDTASFDINQIVNKVSEQFKGEIDDLKHKIDVLKLELDKKDESLQKISQSKVIKKITPKKDVKLPPPKIKLPVIKKPEHPPHIKAPGGIDVEKPKKTIGIKSIEQVQSKIEQKIEKEKPSPSLEQIPQIEEQVEDEQIITEIPEEFESILDILEESDVPSKPSEPSESLNLTEMPEKPKRRALVPEIIEIETKEEDKKVPFAIEEPEPIEESSVMETEIIEEPTVKEPEFIEKPPTIEKPKITEVSIEEIEAEEIRSTGTELFNVFSSVGEKSTEKMPTLNEAFSSTAKKAKKKKKEEKSDTMAFVGFNDSQSEISSFTEPETEVEEELPSDKDSLYQELIALEGKRYSLEKTFKEVEKSYSAGSIDDNEYKNQSDQLRGRLNGITSKINRIRRVISSM